MRPSTRKASATSANVFKFVTSVVVLIAMALPCGGNTCTMESLTVAAVTGRVIEAVGMKVPVVGAQVLLRRHNSTGKPVQSQITGSDGAFALRGVRTGRYHLRVARHGFVPLEALVT